jgi:hypothetical protein
MRALGRAPLDVEHPLPRRPDYRWRVLHLTPAEERKRRRSAAPTDNGFVQASPRV